MSEHDYLGLDLDEVLEGPDVMPCVSVADREGQVVSVPPLTDDERAMEIEEHALACARHAAQQESDHWMNWSGKRNGRTQALLRRLRSARENVERLCGKQESTHGA